MHTADATQLSSWVASAVWTHPSAVVVSKLRVVSYRRRRRDSTQVDSCVASASAACFGHNAHLWWRTWSLKSHIMSTLRVSSVINVTCCTEPSRRHDGSRHHDVYVGVVRWSMWDEANWRRDTAADMAREAVRRWWLMTGLALSALGFALTIHRSPPRLD